MDLRSIAWWVFFVIAALWLQRWVPGVDFLVLGLILSLQENKCVQTFWLVLLFLLLQEGSGSLAFGAGILWYGAVVGLFILGRWLFEVENVLFILLLGLFLGGWRFLLVHILSNLQEFDVNNLRLLHENLWQALVIPPGWYIARVLRERVGRAAPA